MRAWSKGLPALALACGACAPAQPVGPTAGEAPPTASVAPSALPSLAASPSPSPLQAQVTGFVLDEALGPIVGAEVAASGAAAAKATTDAQGRYALALAPGKWQLVASKAGHTQRSREVDLAAGAASVNFGGIEADGQTNPYFLSGALEVTQLRVVEAKPEGPLVLDLAFSEAVASGAAQKAAIDRVELQAGGNVPFLRTVGGGVGRLQMQAAFQEGGQVLRLTYPHAFLASGPLSGTPRYAVAFQQNATDRKDPVTRETVYEDMGIMDEQGQALGRGRAAYAFLQPALAFLSPTVMVDKTFGFGPTERRWNLTHTSQLAFTAPQDTTLPALLSVSVDVEEQLGNVGRDLMKLTFNKPLRVAKDRDNPHFTRLDKDKDLVVVNVAKENGGLTPLGAAKPLEVEFLDQEPNVLYLRYAFGLFKDQKRVEVILGRDFLDPAGNGPDPAKARVEGVVS